MRQVCSSHRCKRASIVTLVVAAVSLAVALLPTCVQAQYVPPSGYTKAELVTTGGQSLTADDIGVSSGGRLAVFNGQTLTLYNTWQNGRTVIGTITDSTDWKFLTDLSFVGENKVIFGENSLSNTAWSVDFSTPASPVKTEIAPANSFPAIEGVSVLNVTTALITGSTAASLGDSGGLYMDKLNLTNGAITPVVSNVGTGFVGDTGATPAGNAVLLDSGTDAGIARVYNPTTDQLVHNIDLSPGGGSGAYGLAFDSAGNAYVTTANTLTEITGIDSSDPVVIPFGAFAEGAAGFPFPSGLGYTGNSFFPDNASQTGALIVNGVFTNDQGLFAITSIPEPALTGSVLFTAAAMLMCARSRRGLEVRNA